MKKNKNKILKIPTPDLSWKHVWLIILVILAFRLDTESVSHFIQWILNKFLSN